MKTTEQLQREVLLKQLAPKTNHILHFLLCIPTGGLWLIVWLARGLINSHRAYHILQDKPAFELDMLKIKVIAGAAVLVPLLAVVLQNARW